LLRHHMSSVDAELRHWVRSDDESYPRFLESRVGEMEVSWQLGSDEGQTTAKLMAQVA
jgi:hypothetical protein